jgi:hypothetical protein
VVDTIRICNESNEESTDLMLDALSIDLIIPCTHVFQVLSGYGETNQAGIILQSFILCRTVYLDPGMNDVSEFSKWKLSNVN